MRETLLGREIQLDESIPEGIIRMNPQTWQDIKVFAYRSSVVGKVDNEPSRT